MDTTGPRPHGGFGNIPVCRTRWFTGFYDLGLKGIGFWLAFTAEGTFGGTRIYCWLPSRGPQAAPVPWVYQDGLKDLTVPHIWTPKVCKMQAQNL